MGFGYNFKCNECGHEYGYGIGVGFMFPKVYMDLLEDVKDGEYGEEWRELATNTPYVAIDAEERLYVCRKCGYWLTDAGLTLYAPADVEALKAETKDTPWAVGFAYPNVPYVDSEDIRKYYRVLKKYIHKCPKCDSRMRRARYEELDNLPCPECGGKPNPNYTRHFNWD